MTANWTAPGGWMWRGSAAKVGLTQYATMLYGHIETLEERADHLVKIRALQDETKHFVTMTPLSFHPEGTELEHLPHPTGYDDLRNIAVARLMLDNFAHIKSFWIMNTPQMTQLVPVVRRRRHGRHGSRVRDYL